MTSLAPAPLPETIGAYRVVGKLGAGQMGDVYEAIAPSGISVAVKRLRFHGFDKTETHGRFKREIRLSQALHHPNIVRVIDHGFDLGAPYLVMEKLVGHDLEWWLEQEGPLPASVAVSIVRPIAEALAHAHTQGVVHRDFKPANVFLHEEGDTLRPVVCDFGIAKVYDEDGTLTASGAVLGTPLYMAPEQFVDSKRVDARCDVWALGMVLYCAVAGRPALADVNGIAELLVALKDERISQVQSFAPWVQASLARVIHAALLPRERRFASMTDFVVALDRWGPKPEPLTRASLRTVSPEERSRPSAPSGPVAAAAELGAPEDATLADPSKVPTDDFIGTVVGERYLVGQKLGIGGMGAVYDAVDLTMPEGSPARSVALKVMLADARATESSRRFLREARAAQKVQNEHVARVLDVGIDPVTRAHYLVMDRLRGRDLAEIVKSVAALTPEVAISLFIQACDGLEAAHALGIVHRDIKPSNLFVHEEGGRVVLKVCDFGIAKQLIPEGGIESTELTQTGGLLGSPLYMSPEQARSAKNVDARTDVFSLTLSLHEALSGRRPWPGLTSMGEIIVAVVTQDVPHLVEVAPWVDPRISAVVEKGLARDASQRIASMRELADALRPFALDRPIVPADLGAVSAERRAVQHPTLRDASRANIVSTNDPVTMPAKRKSGNRPLVVGTLVAAVTLAGVAGVALSQRGKLSTGATSLHDAPVASNVPAPTASSLPSAQPSATSLAVSASASAPEPPTSVAKTTPGGAQKSKPKPSVTPSATQAASPSQAASGVGRGNTATDLPP